MLHQSPSQTIKQAGFKAEDCCGGRDAEAGTHRADTEGLAVSHKECLIHRYTGPHAQPEEETACYYTSYKAFLPQVLHIV